MFKSEVFPAPLGPMMDRIRPLGMLTDTPSTAVTPPKRFDTPSTDIWTVIAVMRSALSATFMRGPRYHDRTCNRARTRLQTATRGRSNGPRGDLSSRTKPSLRSWQLFYVQSSLGADQPPPVLNHISVAADPMPWALARRDVRTTSKAMLPNAVGGLAAYWHPHLLGAARPRRRGDRMSALGELVRSSGIGQFSAIQGIAPTLGLDVIPSVFRPLALPRRNTVDLIALKSNHIWRRA